jgi:hypothetical protein
MVLVLLYVLIGLWLVAQWQVYGLATALARISRKENIIMGLTEDAAAAIAKMDTAVGSMLEYLKTFPPETTVTDLIAAMNKDADMLNSVLPANVPPVTP